MIIIPRQFIQNGLRTAGPHSVSFACREDEGIYSLFNADKYSPMVPGTVLLSGDMKSIDISYITKMTDQVAVLIEKKATESKDKCPFAVHGYVLRKDGWSKDEVMIVPVKEQLYSRIGGLLETDKLANKTVLLIGLGSGGSPAGVGLVQSGLGNIILMDYDRLEIGNIVRHVLGLSDIGRFKTKAMADYLRDKNPYLNVETSEEKVTWDNIEFVRSLVRKSDLVICASGEGISKRILNKLCVQENKVLVIAGAFRRAYGGNVLRIRPNKSLCFQCFLQQFPKAAQDEEISNAEQAEGLAYTDRPVPIEPGLATDILPISTMVVKLAIQELLQGTETTLRSLDTDLSPALYLWYNRREKDTAAEHFAPLETNIDGMHVLRWYGAAIPREPACTECGDFIGEMTKKHGLD